MRTIISTLGMFLIAVMLLAPPPALAQDGAAEPRAATGGVHTLEDILRRQQGLPVDDEQRRRDALSERPLTDPTGSQLGVLGSASDSDLWRALRYGEAASVSIPDKKAAVLMQSSGESWLAFRDGPLQRYGIYGIAGILVLLLVFYLMRGRIKVDAGLSGEKIERFKTVERFGHWLLAVSFIILAITGLSLLYGREYLMPHIGKEAFAQFSIWGKWAHNNLAWAFMLGLIMVFVMWVWHNLPSRTDIGWLAKGGGIFTAGTHPPAKKFNAGQKVIFWSVILLGASISASGIALLFPFETALFGKTFALAHDWGIADWLAGHGVIVPASVTPMMEQQLAQSWHTIVSIVLIVIVIAHIYIGSIGMQGAFAAMGSGQVDRNWAKEHHSLWVEKVDAKAGRRDDGDAERVPAERVPAE